MGSGRIRLFVGIFPPPPIAEGLYAHLEPWKAEMGRETKWTPTEKLHLTLCFLGSVELERVQLLEEQLTRLAAPCFELEAARIGCFPSVGRARVLWAGIQGELAALTDLHAKVVQACRPFLEKHEEVRFAAHITLARVKVRTPGMSDKVENLLAAEAALRLGPWRVLEFRLMRSQLSGKDAGYSLIRSFPLAG